MEFYQLFKETGVPGLGLMLFALFTVWLFKMFYSNYYERQKKQEESVMAGLSILTEALCYAGKDEENGDILIKKAEIYILPADREDYRDKIKDKDISGIKIHLEKGIDRLEKFSDENLNDDSSVAGMISNAIIKSPVAGVIYSALGVLLFYSAVAFMFFIISKADEGSLLFNAVMLVLGGIFLSYIYIGFCNVSKNRAMPQDRAIGLTIFLLAMFLLGLNFFIKGFYVWNNTFFTLVFFVLDALIVRVVKGSDKRWGK